jgi:hypothetical protein
MANGIDEGDENRSSGKVLRDLDPQVATRLAEANAVILAKPGQEQDALFGHAIPAKSTAIEHV